MNKQKIFHIGKLSIFFGKLKYLKFLKIPKISYLNGGSYWKFGILWLNYVIELSHPKKDNKIYRKITSKELDEILK